jgi:hypothetical protein
MLPSALIVILELVRLEPSRFLVYDVPGKVERVLGDFDVLDLVEIFLFGPHFVGIAQQFSGSAPGEAMECFNPNAAVTRTEALSRKPGHAGAVALSRTGDPATGDFGNATVIRKFGDMPADLSAL